MHLGDMSGVALAERRGQVVVDWAGGLADRELGVACSRDTRFQIASVSKQFTAAAVLVLAGDGRLSPGDSVGRWFAGCPGEWRAITVHHLLTHTSGLGHWGDFPALDQFAPVDAQSELAIFQREPLLSPPGARFRYSSPGWVLLGLIVQEVSGQPYADFLAERVFAPLGLRSASAGDPPGGPGMARGYRGGEAVRSFELGTVNLGAGDVWCTAADLLRWDDAVARGELLTPALREAMLTVQAVPESSTPGGGISEFHGYGYGWQVGTLGGRRAYYHSGDNPGYLAVNAWLPDDDIRLAVLANDEACELEQAVAEVLRVAAG